MFDGFEFPPIDKRLYEPLKLIALAMKLGYVVVYDSRFKKPARPPFNLTHAVPLSSWPGTTTKNNGVVSML